MRWWLPGVGLVLMWFGWFGFSGDRIEEGGYECSDWRTITYTRSRFPNSPRAHTVCVVGEQRHTEYPSEDIQP